MTLVSRPSATNDALRNSHNSALLAGDPGADDVRTIVVVLEAGAFTAVALRVGADADLVDLADLGTGRDEPPSAAEVLELVAVRGPRAGATDPATVYTPKTPTTVEVGQFRSRMGTTPDRFSSQST
jgi:hypothetical protein